MNILNSDISFNIADDGDGGGIYATGICISCGEVVVNVVNSNISYNSGNDGGGIHGDKVNIMNTLISNNHGSDGGGMIMSRR